MIVCVENKCMVCIFGYIGGCWVGVEDIDVFFVMDLVDYGWFGDVVWLIGKQVGYVVDEVSCVFLVWVVILFQNKVRILKCWYDLIFEYKEDFVLLMMVEQGKLILEV